ncbi:MAG: ASCH domain-containing protein [Spirochaetaceae bacterium]|nr:ASCH domain-containing protein [Spirochaetaceae bacterium]
MKHEMKVQPIYFNKIKTGEKIYEVRLNDEKRRSIDVGDFIIFKNTNQNEELCTKVKDLIYFDSFDEMVNTLPSEKIGFCDMDKTEIVKVYNEFYTQEDEEKLGVVAIKIEPMASI